MKYPPSRFPQNENTISSVPCLRFAQPSLTKNQNIKFMEHLKISGYRYGGQTPDADHFILRPF